jgi:hypothetical protein
MFRLNNDRHALVNVLHQGIGVGGQNREGQDFFPRYPSVFQEVLLLDMDR